MWLNNICNGDYFKMVIVMITDDNNCCCGYDGVRVLIILIAKCLSGGYVCQNGDCVDN